MGWICPLCLATPINPRGHRCAALQAAPAANEPPAPRPWKLQAYDGRATRMITIPAHLIPTATSEKYDAAIDAWMDHRPNVGGQFAYFREHYTDLQLATLNPAQHLATINAMWEELIDYKQYLCPVGAMDDPGAGCHPSSRSNPDIPAFTAYGICFRCDGRDPTATLQTGLIPFYRLRPPAPITGTILQQNALPAGARAGFWRDNADIVNETSVCVSRTLRGCGKFPEPSRTGVHYIYAFKLPRTKAGFDTEHEQVRLGRPWQPGEKAFAEISPAEIIAWTPVHKLGSNPPGSNAFDWFEYQFTELSWNFLPGASPADRQYLDAELRAVCANGRVIRVLRQEDFAAEAVHA